MRGCVIGRVAAAFPTLCRQQTGKKLVRKCLNMCSRDNDHSEDKTDQPIQTAVVALPPPTMLQVGLDPVFCGVSVTKAEWCGSMLRGIAIEGSPTGPGQQEQF